LEDKNLTFATINKLVKPTTQSRQAYHTLEHRDRILCAPPINLNFNVRVVK